MKRKSLDRLCLLLLIAVIMLSAAAMWKVSATLLDGDASAEMALAKHLSETNRILSEDWFYSTELRVANIQLVYAILFKFMDSWRLVRFAGSMILQCAYLASYGYFAYQAGLSRRGIFLSMAGLMLPVSISYGRIVLYHNYYIPHLAFGFLMAGLLISADRRIRAGRRVSCAARCALLLAVSFVTGLGGIRQAFTSQIPMLAAALLYWLKKDLGAERRGEKSAFASVRPLIFMAAGACASFGAGFFVNHFVLCAKYSVLDFEGLKMQTIGADRISELIYGIFHLFGYRKDAGVFTLSGILSLCSIPAGAYCLYHGAAALFAEPDDDSGRFIAKVFFPVSMLVMLCVFAFSSLQFEFIRYLIPCAVWVAPMIALRGEGRPGRFYARNALCIAVAALMAVSGLGNVRYVMADRRGGQIYEGLTGAYTNANLVKQIRGAVEFADESGYTHVYVGGGNANTVAELTDGRLTTVSFARGETEDQWCYYDWLTVRTSREIVPEQDVLLLTNSQAALFENLAVSEKFETVYDDGACKVMVCDRGGTFKAYLDAQPTVTRHLDD